MIPYWWIAKRGNAMKLTIFTPTYNRAYTLPRLFNSLLRQTDRRFEWLICDDGSSDNTDEVVQHFIETNPDFQIIYLKQKHGGKHRAQNMAIQYASGDYFITCDSNKYLADDAVAEIMCAFDSITNVTKMCGIGGYRADFQGNIYGGNMCIDGDYVDCTNLERLQYNLGGDKASAFFTDVLKKYPFPEFENEVFVSESAWLTPMAMDGYKIRWFPKILIYGEYAQDGLTKQGANGYRGHYDNYMGFLHVLSLEIRAYGLEARLPEIYEAFQIAKTKGISDDLLSKKLEMTRTKIYALKLRCLLGKVKRVLSRY